MFRIDCCADVFPPEEGVYSSFPSLAQNPQSGEVHLLYRQARFDPENPHPLMKSHGVGGRLMRTQWRPESQTFGPSTCLIDGTPYPPGLMDGVLTWIEDRWFLTFRRFPNEPSLFYAQGETLEHLSLPKAYPRSTDPAWPIGAQWGKVFSLQGVWLQTFYMVHFLASAQPTPGQGGRTFRSRVALFESRDQGHTWQFRAWVTPPEVAPGLMADETAVHPLADGTLLAVMRTSGKTPCPFYQATSTDGGHIWTTPQPVGLNGQAPMLYTLPNGTVLLGYRGYCDDPDIGGTFSLAPYNPQSGEFQTPFVVDTYHGNHYDGGYGDMTWLPESNQLLVAYYVSNTVFPRYPWLRWALLSLVS